MTVDEQLSLIRRAVLALAERNDLRLAIHLVGEGYDGADLMRTLDQWRLQVIEDLDRELCGLRAELVEQLGDEQPKGSMH